MDTSPQDGGLLGHGLLSLLPSDVKGKEPLLHQHGPHPSHSHAQHPHVHTHNHPPHPQHSQHPQHQHVHNPHNQHVQHSQHHQPHPHMVDPMAQDMDGGVRKRKHPPGGDPLIATVVVSEHAHEHKMFPQDSMEDDKGEIEEDNYVLPPIKLTKIDGKYQVVRLMVNPPSGSNSQPISLPSAPDEIFACQECGKPFPDTHKLKRHSKVHGEKGFICDQDGCGKRFLDKSKLKRHQLVHTKDRPFVCEHPGCDKRFSLAYNRTIHMRIHSGHKPFVCDVKGCTAAFAQASNLKSHKRTHDKRKSFRCEYQGCGEEFAKRTTLKQHTKGHVNDHGGGGFHHDYTSSPAMDKSYNTAMSSVPGMSLSSPSPSNPHQMQHPQQHPMSGPMGPMVPMTVLPSNSGLSERNMIIETFRLPLKGDGHDSTMHYGQPLAPNDLDKFDCKVCGLEFNAQMQLNDHVHTQHGMSSQPHEHDLLSR